MLPGMQAQRLEGRRLGSGHGFAFSRVWGSWQARHSACRARQQRLDAKHSVKLKVRMDLEAEAPDGLALVPAIAEGCAIVIAHYPSPQPSPEERGLRRGA